MKLITLVIALIFGQAALAAEYTLTGTNEGQPCEVKLYTNNGNMVVGFSGSGIGNGWAIDIFDHCDGWRCKQENEMLQMDSIGGYNFSKPENFERYRMNPQTRYTGGPAPTMVIRGKKTSTDNVERITLTMNESGAKFKARKSFGITLAKKEIECKF